MKNDIEKENIICMDREAIIAFIKDNVGNKETHYKIRDELIEAILNIIPLLGHYEEEDKKLNFKVAIGLGNNMENLIASSYVLKRYIWIRDETYAEKVNRIEKLIKEVAVFCEKSADIFLVQKENEIECGIFFSRLTTANITIDSFIDNNFILFQHLYKNKVLADAKNQRICICMDLDKNDNMSILSKKYENDVCRKWGGIFDQVRRIVHGTICLIVDSDWKPEEDTNFTDSIKTIDLDLKIKSNPSVDDIQDFENKLEMFLSMLNYDGITIIDTDERIRAYYLFCKVKADCNNKVSGGARHRAYNSLKHLNRQDRRGYVAVYFQSQEGEVEFYKFADDEAGRIENETINYFDADIMVAKNPQMDLYLRTVKEKYQKIQCACEDEFTKIEQEDLNFYHEINKIVDELYDAHIGFNNFYKEPIPAENLYNYVRDHGNEVIELLKKYDKIRVSLINILFECIIGYGSGYSWKAQEHLNLTFSIITEEIWKVYFENQEYLDTSLLWGISSSGPYERWINKLNEIKNRFLRIEDIISRNQLEPEKYRRIYTALATDDNKVC